MSEISHFEEPDIVTSVHLYPIKSCHETTYNGEPITQLEVGPTGFQIGDVRDRGWVIDDGGVFVSQRGWDECQALKYKEDRILATVRVDIRDTHLHVSAQNHGELDIPLEFDGHEEGSVKIFGPELPVVYESDDISEYYSSLLGRAVKLAKADTSRPRVLPEKYCREGAANRSAGADGRPFSFASQSSLDFLHDQAGIARGSLPITAYRANVVIGGDQFGPFGEDYLRFVRIGKMGAHVVKALSRCPIPNINQETGDDSQRLSTKLTMTRRGWVVGDDVGSKPEPFFAQSLNHEYDDNQTISVGQGDPVKAEEFSETPNVILKVK